MQIITPSQVFVPTPNSFQLNTQQNQPDQYSQNLCKFCFQTEKQSHQKLISPCGCSGSLKHVHKDCLQKWLNVQANQKDCPLADISFKLRRPDLKCKLCEQQIVFQTQYGLIGNILAYFHWLTILCFLKKFKYYACISILGSLAINYYFLKFFFERVYKVSIKIKDNSFVSLIILSLILILLQQTFIEVKWNNNNLELSIPFFSNK